MSKFKSLPRRTYLLKLNFYFGKIWKNLEKLPFFRADMAGLGKYHMGGYGRIEVYRVIRRDIKIHAQLSPTIHKESLSHLGGSATQLATIADISQNQPGTPKSWWKWLFVTYCISFTIRQPMFPCRFLSFYWGEFDVSSNLIAI